MGIARHPPWFSVRDANPIAVVKPRGLHSGNLPPFRTRVKPLDRDGLPPSSPYENSHQPTRRHHPALSRRAQRAVARPARIRDLACRAQRGAPDGRGQAARPAVAFPRQPRITAARGALLLWAPRLHVVGWLEGTFWTALPWFGAPEALSGRSRNGKLWLTPNMRSCPRPDRSGRLSP